MSLMRDAPNYKRIHAAERESNSNDTHIASVIRYCSVLIPMNK